MSQYFEEVYFDVEKAIELAFDKKFVLNFYEYLKIKGVNKIEVDQFLNSSTANEIGSLIVELGEYIKGGKDNDHKQLREAYHHIPKPQARKIKNYLNSFLEDAVRYSHDRRPGRRKKGKKK